MAHYDTQWIGLHHILASKVWVAVHDPGCTELNMGMFTQEAGAASGGDSNFRHCVPESLDAFRIFLSTARAVL